MTAALLMGYGGFEKLEVRDDVPVPVPGPDDVLIKVAAAGINNTDINTRIGWYAKSVTGETNAGGASGFDELGDDETGSWSGIDLNFPLIQGGDCCGYVVGVGEKVDEARIGERVLVRNIIKSPLTVCTEVCVYTLSQVLAVATNGRSKCTNFMVQTFSCSCY